MRGALLFNGESAAVNSGWIEGQPDAYNPVTMAAVTVNNGGTLGGTGILRAPVTVHSGGMLSPGASAGVFTVDSLTLDAGSTTLMELGGLTAGNGAGYHDQVLVTDLLSLGGTLELALLGGFEPEIGDSFVLFEYGSLGATHNAFDTLSIPFDGEFTISYGTGTNSQVVLRAVPEPGALVLLLLGLAALLLRAIEVNPPCRRMNDAIGEVFLPVCVPAQCRVGCDSRSNHRTFDTCPGSIAATRPATCFVCSPRCRVQYLL